MSTHSHYLFLHCIRLGKLSSVELLGAARLSGSLPASVSPSSSTSSDFRLAPRQHAGPSHATDVWGYLFFRGTKQACCTLMGRPGAWQGPGSHWPGWGQDTVTRGPRVGSVHPAFREQEGTHF